jgi:ferredoxin
MKAKVDKDVCSGCELCTQTCPDVFRMEGDVAIAYNNPVPKEFEAQVKEAADECPVSCISVE